MRSLVLWLLLASASLGVEVQQQQFQMLRGVDDVVLYRDSDLVLIGVDGAVDLQPVVVVKVSEISGRLLVKLTDENRSRLPIRMIADLGSERHYLIDQPRRQWLELIDLELLTWDELEIDLAPPEPLELSITAPSQVTEGESFSITLSRSGGRGSIEVDLTVPEFLDAPQRIAISGDSVRVDVAARDDERSQGNRTGMIRVTSAGASASAEITIIDDDAPPVPGDIFDNIGRRVAEWTAGLPHNRAIADIYADSAARLRSDPTFDTETGIASIGARIKAIPGFDPARYAEFARRLNEDLSKRWEAQAFTRGLLADYWDAVARGLGHEF